MRSLIFLCCALLAGCATPAKRRAEALGYERGYQDAVREQYWLIQNQQRQPATDNPGSLKP